MKTKYNLEQLKEKLQFLVAKQGESSTEIILSIKQLCELLEISRGAYNKAPDTQLDKFKPFCDVGKLEKEHSNSTQYFKLTLLETDELPAVFLEANDEVEITKNSEAQIELLLKAVLFDGILPLHGELSKVIGKHKNTVGNRVKEMYELGILLPIPTETITEIDPITKETIEYQRKKCHWYYYDTVNGEVKNIVDTTEVHNAYGKYFNQHISYLRNIHGNNYDGKIGSGLADKYAKDCLNKLGFNSINRVAEWIVNDEYVNKLYKKYRHK